jgi:hypothetical protein
MTSRTTPNLFNQFPPSFGSRSNSAFFRSARDGSETGPNGSSADVETALRSGVCAGLAGATTGGRRRGSLRVRRRWFQGRTRDRLRASHRGHFYVCRRHSRWRWDSRHFRWLGRLSRPDVRGSARLADLSREPLNGMLERRDARPVDRCSIRCSWGPLKRLFEHVNPGSEGCSFRFRVVPVVPGEFLRLFS